MNRTASLLVPVLVGLLGVGLLSGGFVGVADSAAGQSIVVTNVSVAPDTVTPNEPATVTATIRNPASNTKSFEIGSVALRNQGEDLEEYARARGLGTLTPGSEMRVALHRTFSSSGAKQMRLIVYPGGSGPNIQHPVLVNVEGPSADEPRIDVDAERVVANAETRLNITMANSLQNKIFGAEIAVDGEQIEVADGQQILGGMEQGANTSLGFDVTPSQVGTVTAKVKVTYTTDEGTETAVRKFDLESVEPNPGLVFDARSVTENGSTVIEATLTNDGNAPLRNLNIRSSSGASVSKSVLDPIYPDEQQTVELHVESVNGSGKVTVPLTASYTAAGEQRTTKTNVGVTANPGAIRLTGLRVQRQGSKLQISGSTSNVGLSKASAVLVEVVDTEKVTPTNPNRDYFVGAVPANEFVTFDVYAQPTGSVSSVPVRVEYIVNGERRTHVTDVPASMGMSRSTGGSDSQQEQQQRESEQSSQPESNSGLSVAPLAFGAVVVVGIGGVMLRGWRRSRGGD